MGLNLRRSVGVLVALAAVTVGCAPAAPSAPTRPTTAPPAAATSAVPSTATTASTAARDTAATAPVGTAAGTAARGLPPRPDRPPAKVTIGVLGTTYDAVFYLAEEKGYFEHMRLEPVFERFDSGARMVTSLATNQVEIGSGSVSVGLYNAIARGIDVKIVADRASSRPGHDTWQFFLRKELADSGAIRDYADLRGRRLAIAARGTSGDPVIGRALERGGLTFADVEIVEMPYPDMATAMATGAIDVGMAPEPFVSIAVQRAGAVKWKGAQELVPNQVSSTLMYTGQFVQVRPDIARDFMVVYVLAARDYNDAFMKGLPEVRAQAEDTILRRTDLRDPDLLGRVTHGYINPDGTADRAAIVADYQWFRQHGGLTETVDLDAVLDERFAAHAVSLLGPYR